MSSAGGTTWREWLPGWLSAAAAIATVALTVLGYNALMSGDGSATAVAAASLTTWEQGPDGLRYEGEYHALRSGQEDILVMGQPRDAGDTDWTTVQAQRTPTRTDDTAGTEDGMWSARMPISVSERWVVRVVIARGGLQGIADPDLLEELRREGPDASIVTYVGEPVVVEPED